MLRAVKGLGWGLLFICSAAMAADKQSQPTELTDQCVLSVRNVYRFYYHQVHPNPNPACHTNLKMEENSQKEMERIIGELKNNCPASLIAQVNQSLQLDTEIG